MKNKFIKLLLVLFLSTSLVQCSNKTQNKQTQNTQTQTQNNNTQPINPTDNTNDVTEFDPYDEEFISQVVFSTNPADYSERNGTMLESGKISSSKYRSVVPIVYKKDGKSVGYLGTGTIIGPNTVITNKHVTETARQDTSKLEVLLNVGDTTVSFEVEEIIEFNDPIPEQGTFLADLSILHVKPVNNKSISDGIELFELATLEEIQNLKVGDLIEYAGYPGRAQPNLFYDQEKIVSLGTLTEDGTGNQIEIKDAISIDSLVQSGQSGSSLLNSDNKIIGLIVGSNETHGSALRFNETMLNFIKRNIK